ncbi:MAG: hypothetical protein ACP5E2_16010 [Terracidiphilus sp.]
MTKLKIEHGASKARWVLLKTTIEEPTAADIDLLCQWSENDRRYVINELLRFALAHAEDFQQYKTSLNCGASRISSASSIDRKKAAVLAATSDTKGARTTSAQGGQ